MIFYLHVPKTGGQTLAKRLASAFRPEDVHIFQPTLFFPVDLVKLAELKKSKRFVESHVTDRLLENAEGFDIMTSVRDPVEQTISNWRHIRREPSSPFHRAAVKFRPRQFFDNFHDYFIDYQSTYILGAFLRLRIEEARLGRLQAFTKALAPTLDRIRWLAPTESIDEFVQLWSLEMGRWVPNNNETMNVTAAHDPDVDEVREHLLKRRDWFRVDDILRDLAIERHAAYRNRVLLPRDRYHNADNSRLAYEAGEERVWLTENWYDPQPTAQGLAWWAGPKCAGRIHVRRTSENRFLAFDVIVINGVSHDSIAFLDPESFQPLPIARTNRDGCVSFCVDLQGMGPEHDILVFVPHCPAAIMTTLDHDGLTRQSFAAVNWRLSSEPFAE